MLEVDIHPKSVLSNGWHFLVQPLDTRQRTRYRTHLRGRATTCKAAASFIDAR